MYLIECKAIGVDLKDNHLRQAIEYSTTKGIDWAILTNGTVWKVYKISFSKPVQAELLFEIDFLNCSHKDENTIEKLFLLSKEAIKKSFMEAFHEKSKAASKSRIAAAILTEPVLRAIWHALKSCPPDVKIDVKIEIEDIKDRVQNEVVKRDILEGDEFKEASKKLHRCLNAGKNNKAKSSGEKATAGEQLEGETKEETSAETASDVESPQGQEI